MTGLEYGTQRKKLVQSNHARRLGYRWDRMDHRCDAMTDNGSANQFRRATETRSTGVGEQRSGQPGRRFSWDVMGISWFMMVHMLILLIYFGGEWGFAQQTWGYELDFVGFNGI